MKKYAYLLGYITGETQLSESQTVEIPDDTPLQPLEHGYNHAFKRCKELRAFLGPNNPIVRITLVKVIGEVKGDEQK